MRTTPLRNQAAPAARQALNFAAPALVVGLLLSSPSYGLNFYPPGQAGGLERTVDRILATEQIDILRENRLITTQNAIGGVLDVLNQKLDQATDPAEAARIERQIAARQAQYQTLQQAIDRNGQLLARDLNTLNGIKDNALTGLGNLPRPRKQIEMFITAASQREQTYVTYIRNFLRAHPVSPVSPF